VQTSCVVPDKKRGGVAPAQPLIFARALHAREGGKIFSCGLL
jgi:hypothetical protein